MEEKLLRKRLDWTRGLSLCRRMLEPRLLWHLLKQNNQATLLGRSLNWSTQARDQYQTGKRELRYCSGQRGPGPVKGTTMINFSALKTFRSTKQWWTFLLFYNALTLGPDKHATLLKLTLSVYLCTSQVQAMSSIDNRNVGAIVSGRKTHWSKSLQEIESTFWPWSIHAVKPLSPKVGFNLSYDLLF